MSRDPDCDLCLERDARDALAKRVEELTAERDALRARLRGMADACPTPCDDDCDVLCHEEHAPPHKRYHAPNHHAELRELRAELAAVVAWSRSLLSPETKR